MKSVLAIIAGFVVATVLALGADYLLVKAAPEVADAQVRAASPPLLALMLAYTALSGVAGSFVAAWLAPRRPLMHAVILGVIALLFTLAATTVYWSTLPAWYHVLTLLLVLPAAWLGGRLYARPGRQPIRTAHRSR